MKAFKSLTFIVLMVIIAAVAAIFISNGHAGDDVHLSAVSVGQKAPLFQAETVDGKAVNFPADFKGKVVLLDF